MTGSTGMTAADRARALRDGFQASGFTLCTPAILQPAEVFVQLSGENIRSRLYMVADPAGGDLCLRPDFTIPVALAYLGEAAPAERRYCYAGPAFRHRGNGAVAVPGEFEQAGIEIFGAGDHRAADAEVVALALRSVMAQGLKRPALRIGDLGLFNAVVDALALPAAWRRRIRRHFWRHNLVGDLAAALAAPPAGSSGEAMAAALAGLEREAACDMVEEVLALAGIVPVGGRTAEEIAQRFMERAGAGTGALPQRAVTVIRDYLAIAGEPAASVAAVRALAAREGLALDAEITRLERSLEDVAGIAAGAGLGQGALRFEAEFGRNLEYYTGLVFEICDAARPGLKQIAGGGRYDRLLGDLGAEGAVPAVGCAVYVDRLLAALEAEP